MSLSDLPTDVLEDPSWPIRGRRGFVPVAHRDLITHRNDSVRHSLLIQPAEEAARAGLACVERPVFTRRNSYSAAGPSGKQHVHHLALVQSNGTSESVVDV